MDKFNNKYFTKNLNFIDFNEAKLISEFVAAARMFLSISDLIAMQEHYLYDLKTMIVIIIQLSGIKVSDIIVFSDDLRVSN